MISGLATDYPANHVIEKHVHDVDQIIHTIHGVMHVFSDEGIWVVPPGRGLWMPRGYPHEIKCSGHVKSRTVYLTEDTSPNSSKVYVFDVSNLLREVIVQLTKPNTSEMTFHLCAILKGELLSAIATQLYLPKAQNKRINKLATVYLNDPANQSSLSDWATQLGYSHRTLIRHIQKETGMSFREYRRQARILASLPYLAEGVSITNIALNVGFESPSAFIQSFKSVTGKTPGQFRITAVDE